MLRRLDKDFVTSDQDRGAGSGATDVGRLAAGTPKPHSEPRSFLKAEVLRLTGRVVELEEQLEVAREALERIARDYSPAKRAGAEAALALTRIDLGSNPASEFPTLDDRNPASVVGVPWNEDGYAGGDSNQDRGRDDA